MQSIRFRTVAWTALAVLALTSFVIAYPSGSPKCSAMTPKHKTNKAQTSAAPYQITTSVGAKGKDGKTTVTVTLSGKNNAKFKGFYIYASKVGTTDKIGKFAKTSKTSLLSCGSSNAISHVDNDDKTSVTVTWTSAENQSGEVEFRATVVKEFKTFWTDIKSSSVKLA